MLLCSYPSDFSSALGENLFCFEGADASSPTEISFYLDSATPTLLGAKRFLGRSEFAADAGNFLRRSLKPRPTVSSISRLVFPEGRNVVAYAAWGDNYRSASIPFVASTEPFSVMPSSVGGAALQSRLIGRSEMDEIAFSAPAESAIRVVLTFSDGQSLSTGFTASRGGLWTFFLNASSLLGMISEGALQAGVEVVVSVSEQEVVRVAYTFVERGEGAVRLAWLSPSGAICYHTFPVAVSEHWRAKSRAVECSSEGLVTLSAEGWGELELFSGHLAEGDAERLSTLLSSPFVWRCMADGSYLPQHILSGSSTLRGGRGGSLSLTLRPSEAFRTW